VKPISEFTDDELREDRLINVGNPMAEHLAAEVLRLREQLGSLPQMLRAAEAELADLRAHTAVNRESLARADERWDKAEAELAAARAELDEAEARAEETEGRMVCLEAVRRNNDEQWQVALDRAEKAEAELAELRAYWSFHRAQEETRLQAYKREKARAEKAEAELAAARAEVREVTVFVDDAYRTCNENYLRAYNAESELARQKPVVDAAVAWKNANRDGFYGRGRMSDDLIEAVRALLRDGGGTCD
jgi:chromosome segregation ATPase